MKKFEELDDKMLESVVGGTSAEDKQRSNAIVKFITDYKGKCSSYARAGDGVPNRIFLSSAGKGMRWFNNVIRFAVSDPHGAVNIIDVMFAPGIRELSATYPEFAEFLTRLDNLHNG